MDVFNGFVLTAHMLQHMVLMMIAPPLVLLGAPLIPMVRGLPVFAAREFAGPFLNWPARRANRTHADTSGLALLLMGIAMFAWHTPALYELALRSPAWHQVEHACFFVTSLIFWWPVVQPWPSKAHWPRWAMVPYLLVADLQNTALSAILVFSDRVLYPSYSAVPRLFGFLRARRSGRCRCHHVGRRIVGLHRAGHGRRGSVLVKETVARINRAEFAAARRHHSTRSHHLSRCSLAFCPHDGEANGLKPSPS